MPRTFVESVMARENSITIQAPVLSNCNSTCNPPGDFKSRPRAVQGKEREEPNFGRYFSQEFAMCMLFAIQEKDVQAQKNCAGSQTPEKV